ncbi:hypothetical protein, partial [Neisseria dentiae]|uniref:hypothetical protein n=1 Tax=Neisseria dentiae TaxID=194197 RepID=UPI00359F5839
LERVGLFAFLCGTTLVVVEVIAWLFLTLFIKEIGFMRKETESVNNNQGFPALFRPSENIFQTACVV